MPRKQKVVQDLDIVEIQDGVEVGPVMEENDYQFNDPDPNVKAQAKQKPTSEMPSTKGAAKLAQAISARCA